MKKNRMIVGVMAGVLLMAGGQALASKTSMEMGESLFKDSGLGGSANAKTCASCHAGGKGLQSATEDKKLVKLINRCLTDNLEGSKLDGRTAEMRSLKMYIKSLAE